MSDACNLCASRERRIIETSSDGVCTVKCRNCGFIFLNPVPATASFSHYGEDYYRPWIEEQAAPRQALWQRRLELLNGCRSVGRLLDVGCGNGDFLRIAKEGGWETLGTEVSDWAIKHMRERLGLDVRQGDLVSLDLEEGSFDAVTMWHVLEHTADPSANLRKARQLLKKNGVPVLAVPNASNHIFRAVYALGKLRFLRYYTPGEREVHISHFTPSTLRQMLDKSGFRVVKIGIDHSALKLPNKIVESAACALKHLTGLNWGEALEAVTIKPGQ